MRVTPLPLLCALAWAPPARAGHLEPVTPAQLPPATTSTQRAVTYGTAAKTAAQGNDSRITGALKSSATALPSAFTSAPDLSSDFVDLTSNQTVQGTKTWVNTQVFNSTMLVPNVNSGIQTSTNVTSEWHPWYGTEARGTTYQYLNTSGVGVYDTTNGSVWNYGFASGLFSVGNSPPVGDNSTNVATTAWGQGKLSHVLNVGALATWINTSYPVMRDDVGVIYADTGATCTAPDGFAQIQPTIGGSTYAGHCWQISTNTRWSPRIWGANGGNDSAAWVAALAYLGALGNAQELVDDVPQSTIAQSARVLVPSNVTIRGLGTYQGANTLTMSTVYFSQPTGGFTLGVSSALTNLSLIANSSSLDHLVEVQGPFGLRNIQCSYYVSCVRMTTTISTAVSSTNLTLNTTSGLTNGTYNNVAFTGGNAGTGATLNITVAGGTVTAATISSNGTGYPPFFNYGLAANALYSGSPVITLGQIDTANAGRSSIKDLFMISNNTGSANNGVGLEIDGAYDFVDVDDVEAWSPSSIQGTGIGFRFGHVDGLNLHNPKCFGIYQCIVWTAPVSGIQSFGAIDNPQIDGVQTGMYITFPLAQLTITSGYTRALGKPLYLNSPGIQFVETGHAFYTLSDNSQFADFGQLTLSGNSWTINALSGVSFGEVYVGLGSGSQSGAGNFNISGNTFDGRVPAITLDNTTKGGLVGPNRWPGRQYAATNGGNPTPGYMNNAGTANVVEPITGGQISLAVNSSGQVTIPWNLGSGSQTPSVSIAGASGYLVSIANITTEGMVVQVYNASGAAVTSGTFTFIWRA